MKKKIVGTTILATLVAAGVVLRRLGPTLAERGMKKCNEMMARHMTEARPGEHAVPDEVSAQAQDESARPDADLTLPVNATV